MYIYFPWYSLWMFHIKIDRRVGGKHCWNWIEQFSLALTLDTVLFNTTFSFLSLPLCVYTNFSVTFLKDISCSLLFIRFIRFLCFAFCWVIQSNLHHHSLWVASLYPLLRICLTINDRCIFRLIGEKEPKGHRQGHTKCVEIKGIQFKRWYFGKFN